MRKNILNIAKLPLNFIDESQKITPEYILRNINYLEYLSFLKKTLTPKEILVVSFLSSAIHNKTYVEGLEYVIDSFLFSFSIIHFEEGKETASCDVCDGDNNMECPECYGSGDNQCDECGGRGMINCNDCDGDGEDQEGNTCENCGGEGEVECEECRNTGSISCSDCNGYGTVDCYNCDSDGNVDTNFHIPFTVFDYIAYNPRLKDKLLKKYNNQNPIMMVDLSPFDVIKNRYQFYAHNDSETADIDIKFQNNSYVGVVNEKPDFTINSRNYLGITDINFSKELDFERFYEG